MKVSCDCHLVLVVELRGRAEVRIPVSYAPRQVFTRRPFDGSLVTRSTAMSVKDPVCGMEIEKEQAAGRLEHDGKAYYFCSDACKEKFAENPEDYAGDAGVEE